jgi:hypothetical protein
MPGAAKVEPNRLRTSRPQEREVNMLCAELEKLEAEFDDILSALENPNLTEQEKQDLRDAYARMSRTISDHQRSGHDGHPCFEE